MTWLNKHIFDHTSIAPLAIFRVLFGGIMFISIIRFMLKGWVYDLYVMPSYYFTFYGFEWVQPLGETGMYSLFIILAIASLFIAAGFYYRTAAIIFFLGFTYVELIDKTNYLNHYYFVSIVSFLLILVPAHRYFSLDTWRKPELAVKEVPGWTVNIIKFQLGVVYFFAGLAKLNTDWLVNAMPLKIWLPAHGNLPLIGDLLEMSSTAYVFSWAGAVYDLLIVFFLLYKPTRVWAYAAVMGFHLMTSLLFQIGMFPYIMILSTLIFFSAEFHENVISKVRGWFTKASAKARISEGSYSTPENMKPATSALLGVFVLLQVLLPLRSMLYPGNVFWTEQGYRFAWRVMLMEKAGYAIFHITDPESGRSWEASNWEYLTPVQEKMMATQPDMILQFAHHLRDSYEGQGITNVEVRAEAYVTMNGRRSRLLVDPKQDLTKVELGLEHKEWIIPFDDARDSKLHTQNIQ